MHKLINNKQIYPPYEICICGSNKKAKFCCLENGKKWFKKPHMMETYPTTDTTINKCYASSLENCDGKLSLEHYISDCVLKYFSDNKKSISIAGTKFSYNKYGDFSIKTLASKVLCERHNNLLNSFDSEALNFIKVIDEIDKNFVDGIQSNKDYVFSGHDLERWLLKTCLAFSNGVLNNNYNIDNIYLNHLYNNEWFNDGTGMYINCSSQFHHFSSVSFMSYLDEFKNLAIAEFNLSNIQILLVLDNKAQIHKLYPDINFMYKPNEMCFKKDSIINNINISWINPPHNNGIFFDYVRSTNEEPCNWQEYEKQLTNKRS